MERYTKKDCLRSLEGLSHLTGLNYTLDPNTKQVFVSSMISFDGLNHVLFYSSYRELYTALFAMKSLYFAMRSRDMLKPKN